MPKSESLSQIRIATLYHFAPLGDCSAVQGALKHACERGGIFGTLILASEGINGTIAGSSEAVDEVVRFIRALPGYTSMNINNSYSAEMPFQRLKVKIKSEIVTMGRPAISPLKGVGEYVTPSEWNNLISDPDTILIDTRNSYEVELGTFRGAIDPETDSFRDFPAWFQDRRSGLMGERATRVAMFCTGGIRCEKATALLKSEGLDKVYHLEGGILNYLDQIRAEESLWEGECFVFDERISVGHGLEPRRLAAPGQNAARSAGR